MGDESVLLELKGVSKRYEASGDSDGAVDVLAGVDLNVRGGESLAVTGPSGGA